MPMICKLIAISLLFHLLACAQKRIAVNPTGCESNPKAQSEMSAELESIAMEDQADRAQAFDSIDWNKVSPRDTERRVRVASIFAEGCFNRTSDYVAAATVFQHGTTADHFYQSFVWSHRAVKLGDQTQLWSTAAAIDRYLVKVGHKQLFGTQLSKHGSNEWCIHGVEPSFPESLRIQYVKLSVKDQIARTLKGIGTSQLPESVQDCDPPLRPSPRGIVPGFW